MRSWLRRLDGLRNIRADRDGDQLNRANGSNVADFVALIGSQWGPTGGPSKQWSGPDERWAGAKL